MPVYEFYCPDCHAIFNFFSRRVDTETRPACPRCGRPDLGRQASLFAIRGAPDQEGGGAEGDGLPAGLDESKLMNAFASMAGELENLDQDDPKQAAQTMRRLFEATGLRLGDGMAEAIRRMEAGEDPDQIDAELGDVLDQEDLLGEEGGRRTAEALKQLRRDLLPAARDDTWYPLHASSTLRDESPG
ncbi:MAG: zinc ribbon domain-containing protein [Thiocapsa sp.]|jgi:putative FmdB family regulatory protein|nr:zinc ribbon domain-containing protein [Thiocapsa sp.]MCG6898068.1 zinc ribbon domain-containing protein [Thiocapsa sp.]MCG6984181.1 zinc ribbon domain-containing protein [Thiocapsa sp.]